jgi:hypothetical protein
VFLLNISSISFGVSERYSSSDSSSQIAQLEKQKTSIQKEIEKISQSDGSAETKQQKIQMLYQQIQQIEIQIQQIRSQQSQKAANQVKANEMSSSGEKRAKEQSGLVNEEGKNKTEEKADEEENRGLDVKA